MGDYHIKLGLEEVKEGNYREALRLLRLGVARSPSNLEGRRVLAEFYELAIKRPDIAADLMVKGLARRRNRRPRLSQANLTGIAAQPDGRANPRACQ